MSTPRDDSEGAIDHRRGLASDERSVVPLSRARSEADFRKALEAVIDRQASRHGRDKVALVMGLTSRQLQNIGNGAFPRIDRVFNLLSLDAQALDPIDRLYARRAVPRGIPIEPDPVSAKLAALLSRTIDMERECSDAGPEITLAELLDLDEAVLRAAKHKLCEWVERIDAYRSGPARKRRGVE